VDYVLAASLGVVIATIICAIINMIDSIIKENDEERPRL
jgi:hypothetical protein